MIRYGPEGRRRGHVDLAWMSTELVLMVLSVVAALASAAVVVALWVI